MSTKYSICLCDDDNTIRKQLKSFILQYGFVCDIDIETYELDSAEKLLSYNKHYDILFLDIRFNDIDIGINVAEKLRIAGNTAIIVLITSYESLSIDGYRAEPFRFIVKPYSKEEIYRLLDACILKLKRTATYISITSDSTTEIMRTDRIIYIYSKKRQRYVICDDRIIITWQSLLSLTEQLPEDTFAYARKGYVVNVEYIATVTSNKIIMDNSDVIPLSEYYKENLIKIISKNIKNS